MMNERPLVSAIIIFLNAEKFIEEAIESIFAQTYEHWELLLVDDGSTDASTDIARGYALRHPGRVHYLEHEGHLNRGMGASRNLGIRCAKGEFIAFLDADDVWLPQKLAQQVVILHRYPEAGMLYGRTKYWFSWADNGKSRHHDYIPPLGVRPNVAVEPPALLPLFLRGKAAVPCTCSILARRTLVDRIGGFEECFQEVDNIYEDQAFYAKVCVQAPVIAADKCWDWYRQHEDASMAAAKRSGQENEARQFYLKWLAGYLRQQQISEPEVWGALKQEMWLSRSMPLPRRPRRLIRWAKKWLLRLEERILPAMAHRWLWARFPIS